MPTPEEERAPRQHDDSIFRGIFGPQKKPHLSKKRRDKLRQASTASSSHEAPVMTEGDVNMTDAVAADDTEHALEDPSHTWMGFSCERCKYPCRAINGMGPFCKPGCPENVD